MKRLFFYIGLILIIAACSDISSLDKPIQPEITLNNTALILSADGGSYEIPFTSSVAWTAEVENKLADVWCSVNPTSGEAGNTKITVTTRSNDTPDDRTVSIIIKAATASKTIKITQKQKDAIVLAKSEYEFGVDGGNLDFEIQTNTDITATISDNAMDWIQQVETRGLETKALYFNVAACSAEEDREGTITISGGNATQTITIKQSGLKETLRKEREALIELYSATNGNNWTNNTNWCSDKPVGEWYGIDTNSSGLLCWIDLSGNNLIGSIPESIGELTILQGLHLSHNQLTGELPLNMAKLSLLRELFLGSNQLSGKVSHIVYALSNIQSLGLDYNNFTGNLPEITDSMIGYSLNYNLFTGGIPESHIAAFENRDDEYKNTEYGWRYEVSYNNLSGEIPDAMVNHDNWHAHWREILPQNPGYGFSQVDLPAPQNVVKCYDGSFLDLGEEYRRNKYTIVFRWDPYCPWSISYPTPIYKLYQKYKEQGLGLVCTTLDKYSSDKITLLTSKCNDVKIFWEVSANQGGADNSWNNNPYGLNAYFYLFRTGTTPYFHIIDSFGNIVFYGSGDGGGEKIPQYHDNRDDIYDFVANLFGDEKYEEGKYYESTDYSRDGEVKLLQAATAGNGIDIVLMGDAFSDRLIADGTYDKAMNTAMEKYFDVEPYKSFRDQFNVYSVTAVSKNEEYVDGASTKFEGYFGERTKVGGNDRIVFEYAIKAVGEERMDNVLIVVLMNSTAYAGTCWMYGPIDNGDWGSGVTISYFPIGTNNTDLAQVLHHEAGGHGFSKLGDEYQYEGEILLEDIESAQMDAVYGWWKNIDFTSDPTKVKWSHFLTDPRFQHDGLGVFEGAFTYSKGAYRPTENSIMRNNTGSFNAPSREAIYYRIHKLAYGADWKYDYEEFVKWDEKNRKKEETRGVPYRLDDTEDFQPTHPPVVINKSWRDAR